MYDQQYVFCPSLTSSACVITEIYNFTILAAITELQCEYSINTDQPFGDMSQFKVV